MASIFPAGIDTTITLPQVVEGITPLNGTIFNQLRDTVIYIESNISDAYLAGSPQIGPMIDFVESLAVINYGGDPSTVFVGVGTSGIDIATGGGCLTNIEPISG